MEQNENENLIEQSVAISKLRERGEWSSLRRTSNIILRSLPPKQKQRSSESQENWQENDEEDVSSSYEELDMHDEEEEAFSRKERRKIVTDSLNQNYQGQENIPQTPLLSSNHFSHLTEPDFDIFSSHLARTKIYSLMLIDQHGRIIFADKLANQHFQGSLNNLTKVSFQSLLLEKQRPTIINSMRSIRHFHQSTTLRYIIYSKNAKRRYCKIAVDPQATQIDVFFRFLKCLTTRLRPIEIAFEKYESFQGFWNKHLIKNNQVIQCYLLESRLSLELPNLKQLDILNDRTVKKFMSSNKRKFIRNVQHKTQQTGYRQGVKKQSYDFRQINKLEKSSLIESEKMVEQIYEEESIPRNKRLTREKFMPKTSMKEENSIDIEFRQENYN